MDKQKLLNLLLLKIENVKNQPDNTLFNVDIRIKEKSKCPKCSSYNFLCGGVTIYEEECKDCGYIFRDDY
ncbi:hypothetical protein [Arcobacter sp.]|uniref:hypothetical protein n=1 Tax=unclassified Arcobacter TaxID=2593671 RepID=UPI003AFFF571